MRYYFHFLGGDDRLDDDAGIDHVDFAAARAEAVRAARDIIAESLRQGLPVPEDSVIEITDERGRLVDQVSLVAAAFGDRADRRYGRVFNALPQGHLLLTRDFIIVDANAAFLRARQTELGAIAGRSLLDLLPGNFGARDGDSVRDLLDSLQTVVRTRAVHEPPVQRQDIRRRDGGWEERYWRLINTPVLDGNGAVEFIVHQIEDVTDGGSGVRLGRRDISPPAPSVLPPAARAGH